MRTGAPLLLCFPKQYISPPGGCQPLFWRIASGGARGACAALDWAVFSQADLEGAVFDEGHGDYYRLDERQRGQAVFCEE